MADVVVVGSLNFDMMARVRHMPQAGETIHTHAFLLMLGGKGANQAAAVARLGSKAAMVGRVGSDPFGARCVENLAQQGIDTSHIVIDDEAMTGNAIGILPDGGDIRIVVTAGANGRVNKEDIDAIDPMLGQAKLLVLQFEIPQETVRHAIQTAVRRGVQVILNPAPAYPVSADFLSGVSYLIPNETEAAILTDVEIKDIAAAERAARKLLAFGVPVVILTLGDKGCLLATEQGMTHTRPEKVTVVDPTCAGDAFVGGFAVGLLRGLSLPEAVHYANCAGAMAVTKLGSQVSLPYAQEVEQLYRCGQCG